jgi:hypothetical protein
LADLLAVTDAGLTGMDIDELLSEVLERLRGILDADTAAVLLHEVGTNELVARAARGLEEEVRQGVRVPIGVGFAGRIAANRQPVRLHRVDETTVANPILWEKGIQRMLGVPLTLDARLLGVLHVGRLAPRDFTLDDEELLQVAAERVAATIRTRQYAVEAAAAGMLERSLLPVRLPDVPGLQLAARYVPAENRAIGGDWYDAFLLPDGALWVITGDVAGHGLHAAVVMGRVKSALRLRAPWAWPGPCARLTDRRSSTSKSGPWSPSCVPARTRRLLTGDLLRRAPAARRGGARRADDPADVRPGPPLGGGACAGGHALRAAAPGLLLLYTDGLVDVEMGDRCRAGAASGRGAGCSSGDSRGGHAAPGGSHPLDDIALLVLRRDPLPATYRSGVNPELRVRGTARLGLHAGRASIRPRGGGPLPPAAATRWALVSN